MRVLLTASRRHVRSALRRMLEQEPELNVVGTAAKAVDLQQQVRKTQPDLVLLDWDVAELQASDLVSNLHSIHSSLKVVAFSQNTDARQEALAAGADAFVSRETPFEWLLITLRALGRLSPHFVG
jgi:DNA-binding NarL/FixJ family response regulator